MKISENNRLLYLQMSHADSRWPPQFTALSSHNTDSNLVSFIDNELLLGEVLSESFP